MPWKAGIDDNTLVFLERQRALAIGEHAFRGKHGPFKGSKQEIYEGGVRVPVSFGGPNHRAGDLGMGILDLYQTIVDILKLDTLRHSTVAFSPVSSKVSRPASELLPKG